MIENEKKYGVVVVDKKTAQAQVWMFVTPEEQEEQYGIMKLQVGHDDSYILTTATREN